MLGPSIGSLPVVIVAAQQRPRERIAPDTSHRVRFTWERPIPFQGTSHGGYSKDSGPFHRMQGKVRRRQIVLAYDVVRNHDTKSVMPRSYLAGRLNPRWAGGFAWRCRTLHLTDWHEPLLRLAHGGLHRVLANGVL